MFYRNINIPFFARIRKRILVNLVDIIKEENFFFSNVAFLTGNYGAEVIQKNGLSKQFRKTSIYNLRKYSDLSELRSSIINQKSELLITVGGGSINDIGKYISAETSIPLISIPTILSNDGIASPISIIRIDNEYKSLGTAPPIGVIADTDIIHNSNEKFMFSGLGDLISNISAVLDWQLSSEEIGEKIDSFAKNTASSGAVNILYNFKRGSYKSIKDEDLIEDLFEGLIMSAISMIIARSSRPASGAEHNISHAMDRLKSKQLHGIQVGFATLFTLFLHNQLELLEDILNFYKTIGFPVTLNSLGLSKRLIRDAIKIAPTIRDRFTILNKYDTNSLLQKFDEFEKYYLKNF